MRIAQGPSLLTRFTDTMKALSTHILTALIALLGLGTLTATVTAPPLTPIQQLFILKEMKPDVERVGIIWQEDSPQHDELMPQVQRASSASDVQVFVAYVNGIRDVAPSYRTLKRQHDIDVIWILEDDDTVSSDVAREYLIKTATQNGVPILAPSPAWVNAGAPVSLQKLGDDIQIVVNKAAAAATALNVPDKYETQYLTSR